MIRVNCDSYSSLEFINMGCNSDTQYISYAILTGSSVSVLCSVFIIYLSFHKVFDKLTFRLLYHLAINDVLRAVCLVLCIFYTNSTVRKYLSPFYIYSLISSIFWSLYLSVTLYKLIVKKDKNQEQYYKYWFLSNYTIVLGICLVPLATNSYGYTSHICSIKVDKSSFIWRLSVSYLFISFITIADLILYYKIYKTLKKVELNAVKNIIFDRGFVYIILIVVQYLPMVAIGIISMESHSCTSQVLQSCVHIIISFHGLFNFTALILKSHVRLTIKKLLFESKSSELTSLESSLDILNSQDSIPT